MDTYNSQIKPKKISDANGFSFTQVCGWGKPKILWEANNQPVFVSVSDGGELMTFAPTSNRH